MWQPIETAPRDGTGILLGGERLVWCGFYSHEFKSWPLIPISCLLSGADIDAGGQTPCFANPTHWAPLPPAPVAA